MMMEVFEAIMLVGIATGMPVDEAPAVSPLLAGDVMLGRGIDQIQRHSVSPELHERWVRSAERYVEIAEEESGDIPRKVAADYVWGDALAWMARHASGPRIINLETAVTTHASPWPAKGIHYRMHPSNVAILTAAGIDCAVLANNHVLDWQRPGLSQTLEALRAADVAVVGAGMDLESAAQPVMLASPLDAPIQVFALAETGSGVPPAWAAQSDRSGVHHVNALVGTDANRAVERIADQRTAGVIGIASIHWGGNWGYDVPPAQTELAHRLIDEAGIDVIHGHSSHHPKGLGLYRGRLILYGAGDLINDYEGISGHESFRPGITALYLPRLAADGRLIELVIAPFRIDRFRLSSASPEQADWLMDRIATYSEGFHFSRRDDVIVATPGG